MIPGNRPKGECGQKRLLNTYISTMTYVLLIIASLAGIAISLFYLRKNIIRIKEKNKNEPKAYKRKMNYALTYLWYGYLLVFFVGLTVNNLGIW